MQRYTRGEVGRILGLEANRLRYWERLRLVRPRARWGERFYSFGDLVAARTVQRVTQNHIPAKRLRHAVTLLEDQLGSAALPLHELRLIEQGREIAVIPPGASKPFNPIRRQWMFSFEAASCQPKLKPMATPSARELFESALECEQSAELLPQAVENYRQALELAPDWIEAHINLGVAQYQLGHLAEARDAFRAAVKLDGVNGISLYNLGCVLEELGELEPAIENLRQASRAMPTHPDVHFNLALAYEKQGDRRAASEQWESYLRYAPSGPWAEQARARLRESSAPRKLTAPIPFPKKA
ncbi:MAG: tetratricopeptide repeat protein [Candidatus Acidiferrales bacterium]